MSSNSDVQTTIRRYLLGHLKDDQRETVERRLLTDDDFFQELEITKNEVIEEYLLGRLSAEDRAYLDQNLLASAEGNRTLKFARAVERYVSNHPTLEKKQSQSGWITSLWKPEWHFPRAAGVFAILLVIAGIVWISRDPSPPTYLTLALTPSQNTRSASDGTLHHVKLAGEGLRVNLTVPELSTAGDHFHVELTDASGQKKVFDASQLDSKTVSVEIPPAQLSPGHYGMIISKMGKNAEVERIPGTYQFVVD
jgi:hypothetical protein